MKCIVNIYIYINEFYYIYIYLKIKDDFVYEVNHQVSSEHCFNNVLYSQLIMQDLSFETSDEHFYNVHTYASYPSNVITGKYNLMLHKLYLLRN